MFMSTVLDPCHFDGSIMITASHLPYHRNGMKFFTPQGGLEKDEIRELTEIASGLTLTESFDAAADKVDFMAVYESYLCDRIKKGVNATDYEQPLKGLHIIVDAGNGDGGFFASGVLQKLGAETTGSLIVTIVPIPSSLLRDREPLYFSIVLSRVTGDSSVVKHNISDKIHY